MSEPRIALGLRANWQQFALLVLVYAFVGAMVGQERTIVPLIADQDFGLARRLSDRLPGGRSRLAAIAGLTFASGVIVAAAKYETLPARRRVPPNIGEPNVKGLPQVTHTRI